MEIIVQLGPTRKMPLQEGANRFVSPPWMKAVPPENPMRVGIHDEDRPAERVEEDAVCRLGADPPDREEFFPENCGRYPGHPVETPAVAGLQVIEKDAELSRLLAEVAR
jgi:hypothetical protein